MHNLKKIKQISSDNTAIQSKGRTTNSNKFQGNIFQVGSNVAKLNWLI